MYLNCFYHTFNILKNACMIHLIDGMALFFYFNLLGFDVSQPETSDSSDIEPSWRHSQLCDMFNCHQQCPGSFQPFCSKLCFYVCGWASSCKVKLQESCPKKSFFEPLLFNIKYKDNSRYLLLMCLDTPYWISFKIFMFEYQHFFKTKSNIIMEGKNWFSCKI